MESTMFLLMFLGLLFGGMILVLVMGYLGTEEQRAREDREREAEAAISAESVAVLPSFFAELDPGASSPAHPAYSDRLLVDLETYVRAEQAVVTRFVNDPSFASLYRRADASLRAH